MQVLGIYINEGCDRKIIKSLSAGWYPFGDIEDCHKEYVEKKSLSRIKDNILSNQVFINDLYSFNKEQSLKININCIVGKNGSGKSTLLDIYYRIINNFTIKLNDLYPSTKEIFEPKWAPGFDAELYFECNGKLGFIHSYKNSTKKETEKNKVDFIFDDKDYWLVLKKKEDFISELSKSLFYTIGINYSLYSYSEKTALWKNQLYNKNDGYFTPIVLLPYRNNDVININKENKLAEDRIKNLSLLLAISENELIKGYLPYQIRYRNKNINAYKKELKEKIFEKFKDYHEFENKKKAMDRIDKYIIKLSDFWKEIITDNHPEEIRENALTYLCYKTIKIYFTYDSYRKIISNKTLFDSLDILCKIPSSLLEDSYSEKDIKEQTELINAIIKKLITDKDHITLKIRQVVNFFNTDIFNIANSKVGYISTSEFIDYHKNKKVSYDDVVLSLPPSFYDIDVYYRKSEEEKGNIQLKDFSSGECQFLYSLSYIVYHLKNIESIQTLDENDRIKYKNFSLIFDEAELYYHPEYQRTFIFNLIGLLNRCNFKGIQSLNITIITHSPFMLSDIPTSNVSCISKDESNKKSQRSLSIKTEGNTFSANFYDLIENQFFVEAPVGGISENIFNKIIHSYLNQRELPKFSTENFYEKLISIIGDEYFNKKISSMYKAITKQEEGKVETN